MRVRYRNQVYAVVHRHFLGRDSGLFGLRSRLAGGAAFPALKTDCKPLPEDDSKRALRWEFIRNLPQRRWNAAGVSRSTCDQVRWAFRRGMAPRAERCPLRHSLVVQDSAFNRLPDIFFPNLHSLQILSTRMVVGVDLFPRYSCTWVANRPVPGCRWATWTL